ncbi:hypothetical protein GGR50DRAFT_685573 [Xylaria sp. CBS 124048]|nr:hypothetical protein GGR50DRAFT_685573 [Xylaria sp. CBS 124048]
METSPITQSKKRRYSGEHTGRALSKGDDEATASKQESAQKQKAGGIHATTCRDEDYFRNLYSTEPDFHRLGLKYPDLRALLKDDIYLDFSDPAATVQLTRALLKEDFGLEVSLPPDRLCPPVPNRHNYILWLKDLLDSTASSYSEQYEPERRVTGLDVGTGASLIYPLLGCIQRPAWYFIAVDIDAKSLSSARENARLNNLESRIRIVEHTASDALICPHDWDTDTIDFAMVNPPFYASDTELLDLAKRKSQPPHSACTGAPVEMICDGGEVGFVKRIINESLTLRDKVQWYTAMLGKQSSLEVLVDILKQHGITNFAVTTFIQGSKTRRWAIGWSFCTRRPSLSASRGTCGSFAAKRILPPVTAFTFYGPPNISTDVIPSLKKILCDIMESMSLRSWSWDEQRLRGVGFSNGNVWSRAYRRRKVDENVIPKQETTILPPDFTACVFGFSISISITLGDADKPRGNTAIIIRWLQGDDYSLFESFSGVIIRRCLRTDVSGST